MLDKSGMGQANSAMTPGSKEAMTTTGSAGKNFLDTESHRDDRSWLSCASGMNEMRYDAAFESKEVMRDASNPSLHSLQEVKRIPRYLKGRQRRVLSCRWTPGSRHTLTVVVARMRCSTSGGALKVGTFTLKRWSVTRPTIPLSSAEAEAAALKEECVEGTYAMELLGGLTGEPHNLALWTDSWSA